MKSETGLCLSQYFNNTDGMIPLKRSLSHQSLLTETETRRKDFEQFPFGDVSSSKPTNNNNNINTLEDQPNSGSKHLIWFK